jgi:hypothetical protein
MRRLPLSRRWSEAEIAEAVRGTVAGGVSVAGVCLTTDGRLFIFDATATNILDATETRRMRGEVASEPRPTEPGVEQRPAEWERIEAESTLGSTGETGPLVSQESRIERAFSTTMLAAHWGCSPAHIRGMISRGELESFRIGTMIRIPAKEVARLDREGSFRQRS